MKKTSPLCKSDGSTLIEAIVAIFILTVGILSAMAMHVTAINASSSSLHRTDATNVAVALLETLKNLEFDDANLTETTPSPATFARDANDRLFTAANFPQLQQILRVPPSSPAGTVIDQANVPYRLSWDVQDRLLPSGEILNKTIRVHMTWDSMMGQNHLEMTTVKYNNISLEI